MKWMPWKARGEDYYLLQIYELGARAEKAEAERDEARRKAAERERLVAFWSSDVEKFRAKVHDYRALLGDVRVALWGTTSAHNQALIDAISAALDKE